MSIRCQQKFIVLVLIVFLILVQSHDRYGTGNPVKVKDAATDTGSPEKPDVHPHHVITTKGYCNIGTCKNWTFVILLILSTNFKTTEFDGLKTFLHNAIKSCTNLSGEMVVSFTSLYGNETRAWLRSHKDYDYYFNHTFVYDQFTNAKQPSITQMVQSIHQSINLTISSPQPEDNKNGHYILFVTDYEFYLNSVLADTIKSMLEEKHIRLKILEFDGKSKSTSSQASDENYFEMIAEHGHIVEINSVDSLKYQKYMLQIYPCQSNLNQIGLDDDAEEDRIEEANLPKPKKSKYPIWPYILTGGILLVSTIIILIMCFLYKRRNSYESKIFGMSGTLGGNNYYTNFRDKNWLIPADKLQIDYSEKLGSGAFCLVYKGTLIGKAPICRLKSQMADSRLYRDCQVAVKMLPPVAEPGSTETFLQEVNLMKALVHHPHLLRMLGVSEKPELCLVLEFCQNGDLLKFVQKNKEAIQNGEFKYTTLIGFAWQISDGMYFLASKSIIHRDLAARNIFIDEHLTAKIGDFGLCRITDNPIYMTRGGRLPIKWMALESLKHFEFTTKSDVWSYGVVLYEIFSLGSNPYPDVDSINMVEYLESGKRITPSTFAIDEMAKLMQSCWAEKPDVRPDFAEIRKEISKLLEVSTENYGYYKLLEETSESHI